MIPYKNLPYILSMMFALTVFQQVNAEEKIEYHVEIKGINDEDLMEELLTYSSTQKQQDSPPNSLFSLEHRAKKDIPTFIKLLRSKAYYNSKIVIESQKSEEDIALIFQFDLGKPYLLHEVTINQNTENLKKPTLKQLKLTLNTPAFATDILDAEQSLLHYAKQKSFAFAELCPKKVIVNHDLYTVEVNFCLETGEQIKVGAVSFTGNKNVNSKFLKQLIQWKKGVLYKQEDLDEQRLKLVDSRLFTVARLQVSKEADSGGLHPVIFELTERLPRTVSAGLRLTTDEELFLLHFGWEHRNLWKNGESVDAELNISMIKASLETNFRKPVFYHPKNTFIFNTILTREDTDAFKSLRAEFTALVEHQINKKERVSAGLAYQYSRVTEEDEQTENFNLVSLPVRYSNDFSDNFLEPTSGGRIWLDSEPFYDLGSGATFFKQKIRYNHYLSLSNSNDWILAGRLILGNIIGTATENIPSDLRYFAGGGDTVRGYKFQSISPKNENDKFVGGRSLLALSMELRHWITPSIGVVGFMDAGRAYAGQFQKFSNLQMGAGLGLRYKTPIGALRLDLARPLNKRDEDDEFQVYISIGHTF